MLGTYASAALICVASLLVGRALFSIAGRREWSWLEPAVGFGALVSVTGLLARAPGHGTSATLALVLLVIGAAAIVAWVPYRSPEALRQGLPVALVVVLVLSIPFVISGRWGLLGVGFNNDLGLHLAWAEWLRSGVGPSPDVGYPLGPHGLAVAVAAVPGLGIGQAFVGEIVAIGVLTGLTALAGLSSWGAARADELSAVRRVIAATLVAVSYLGASYFAQAAFKETAEAMFVLAFALLLRDFDRRRAENVLGPEGIGPSAPGDADAGGARQALGGAGVEWWERARGAVPILALAGGIFFSYSFAGIAWPVAILALWGLTLPGVRQALAPRALLRFLARPATIAGILVLAGLGVLVTLVGPFGFIHSFNKVAGSNTYGPVSPVEALGVWPTSNYRLNAAGGAQLTGLAGAIGALALLAGLVWWTRRRDLAVPAALVACAALYLISLPFSGDYSQAKALMIVAPLAMLVAIRPLLAELRRPKPDERLGSEPQGGSPWAPLTRLAWAVLAVTFIGGAVYSSFIVLRDAPVGPPGHGGELRAFLPIVHGETVLYAGQDRYAAYGLLGADTNVPLVEFPDPAVVQSPEKPFDTGNAYSPIDFDSFSPKTLDRSPYVITGRAAWNSEAPPGFRRIAATPSYILWKQSGQPSPERQVLLEGTEAGALADCDSPEIQIFTEGPGRASLFPSPVIGSKSAWDKGSVLGTGSRTSQTLNLKPGRWLLSLQYFSPFELTLSAPGFRRTLKPALDGQRPNTISLTNNGQFWPAGEIEATGGKVRFTIETADPSGLQELTGYAGKAYIGELAALPDQPRRVVPLSAACNSWIDWYETPPQP